jgi:hypothetical protein
MLTSLLPTVVGRVVLWVCAIIRDVQARLGHVVELDVGHVGPQAVGPPVVARVVVGYLVDLIHPNGASGRVGFQFVRPDLAPPDVVGEGINSKTERVAQAHGVNFAPRRRKRKSVIMAWL